MIGKATDLENPATATTIADRPAKVLQDGSGTDKPTRFIEDRKLTIPEAARAMGIGANSLRRIIGQGRIPVLRMMKKTLLLAADVEAFIGASRSVASAVQRSKTALPALPEAIAHSRHLEGT
jgi:excisionase family DNA binding protein